MIKYSKELDEYCKEHGILKISTDGNTVYISDTYEEENGGKDNE